MSRESGNRNGMAFNTAAGVYMNEIEAKLEAAQQQYQKDITNLNGKLNHYVEHFIWQEAKLKLARELSDKWRKDEDENGQEFAPWLNGIACANELDEALK